MKVRSHANTESATSVVMTWHYLLVNLAMCLADCMLLRVFNKCPLLGLQSIQELVPVHVFVVIVPWMVFTEIASF